MVIIYAGNLSAGGTCLQRLAALKALGHTVHAVENFPADAPSVVSKIRHRLGWGPGIAGVNGNLQASAREHQADVLWVDKGIYVWPATLASAMPLVRAAVHYNPDDPFGANRWGWRLFRSGIACYDLHFVARDANVAEYLHAGAKRAARFMWGYDRTLHRPMVITPETRERLGAPVGFIGSYEKERADTLYALASAGIAVRVWGKGWEWSKVRHPNLKIENRALANEEYATAICAMDINLCFLRKVNRDQSTTRSIEIPACGAFMLAERTAEHQRLFEERRDADFFSSDRECIEKVKYYLHHSKERQAIAVNGRIRCLESGYDNQSRLSDMLKQVESILRPR